MKDCLWMVNFPKSTHHIIKNRIKKCGRIVQDYRVIAFCKCDLSHIQIRTMYTDYSVAIYIWRTYVHIYVVTTRVLNGNCHLNILWFGRILQPTLCRKRAHSEPDLWLRSPR